MFRRALLEDQADFVELFLDHVIKLKDFLETDDDLSRLYKKVSARVNTHKHTLSVSHGPHPYPMFPPTTFLSVLHAHAHMHTHCHTHTGSL